MSASKLVSERIDAILILVNKDQIESFFSKFIRKFSSHAISGSWNNNIAAFSISLSDVMSVSGLVLDGGPCHIIDIVADSIQSNCIC